LEATPRHSLTQSSSARSSMSWRTPIDALGCSDGEINRHLGPRSRLTAARSSSARDRNCGGAPTSFNRWPFRRTRSNSLLPLERRRNARSQRRR
jgi:hypothetical protein